MKIENLKNLEYRLYPNPTQEKMLTRQLEACRVLYNAALEERHSAYHSWQRFNESFNYQQLEGGVFVLQHNVTRPGAHKPPQINYYTQAHQLKAIRLFEPELALVNFCACQDVLRRVDKVFKDFFERVRRGNTPGCPGTKASAATRALPSPRLAI